MDPPEPEPELAPPVTSSSSSSARPPSPPPTPQSTTNGDVAAPSPPKEVKREENINIHNRVRQQRAQNIFAAPIDLNEEYLTPRYPKSDAAIQFIDSALEDNFIFASLTAKERRLLIDAMMLETIPAGTVIIKQGETGDFFYVIEEGHVSFAVDNQHVGSAGRGGSFGELALLCKFVCALSLVCAPLERQLGSLIVMLPCCVRSFYRQLPPCRYLSRQHRVPPLEGRSEDFPLHVGQQHELPTKGHQRRVAQGPVFGRLG